MRDKAGEHGGGGRTLVGWGVLDGPAIRAESWHLLENAPEARGLASRSKAHVEQALQLA